MSSFVGKRYENACLKSALISVLVFLFTPTSYAESSSVQGSLSFETEGVGDHRHGAHPECPLPKSAIDVVRCAQVENPAVKRFRLSTDQSKGLPDVAKQIPNPDLDIQSGFGKSNGEEKSNVQLGFRQPIEWGGKRSSRIRTAEAQQNRAVAAQTEIEADIVISTVTKLHRLRQVELEKKALLGTIDALTRVINQQKSRAALAPEQQGALSVYRMALSDNRIRESEIFEEERAIEHFFHVSTGHSLKELLKVLPESIKNWPSVTDEPRTSGVSPALKLAFADRELAQSEVDEASAKAWPNLSLGPQVTFEREGNKSDTLIGVALVMDLPLLNLNGAGKAYSRMGLSKAESLIVMTKAEESHERAEQVRIYRNALETLKNSPTPEQIDLEHSQNQKLANRGMISGSLLIESYRQRNDLLKGRNGRELKAIEALWTIYKLDGRIFEETL